MAKKKKQEENQYKLAEIVIKGIAGIGSLLTGIAKIIEVLK